MTSQITISDLKYVCLHEAGHAVATYAVDGTVECLELLKEHAKARGVARSSRPPEFSHFIAAAGYAVEFLLYKANRLLAADGTPLSQKAFIDEAMNNSSEDKTSFFGSNKMLPDGTWPEELDREYMEFAAKEVAPRLQPIFAQIEELAAALESQGRVEQAQIERILCLADDIA